mgnify:CR=1 FL=1
MVSGRLKKTQGWVLGVGPSAQKKQRTPPSRGPLWLKNCPSGAATIAQRKRLWGLLLRGDVVGVGASVRGSRCQTSVTW